MASRSTISRNVCIGLYFFLSGAEYAIILPTINGFLSYLGAEQLFLGFVISGFSLTALLSAPIYGRISDRTKTSKTCIIVGNLFEIGGNFMYFASVNQYMALISRLVAGIGSGASSSIYGMISRTTSEQERTSAFTKFILMNQVGGVIGPAFNIFLGSINFTLGPFKVNNLNAPGLLMTVIWTLHTVLIILLYRDPELHPTTEIRDEFSSPSNPNKTTNSVEIDVTATRGFKEEFLRDEIIVCLTANFLGVFSQCVIETALTPMTKVLFDWGAVENSILFGAASTMVAIGFATLLCISKCVSDRGLLLNGVIGIIFIYIMYTTIFLILRIHPEQVKASWVLPVFLTSVALLTLVLPYTAVAQSSIFSKLTSKETQAFNQGIRVATEGLAKIIGPIWAASLTTISGIPIIMGVNLFLNVLLFAMTILSYDRLFTANVSSNSDTVISTNSYSELDNDTLNEYSPLVNA